VDDLQDLIAEMGKVIQAERQAGGPGQPGPPRPGQGSLGEGPGREQGRAPSHFPRRTALSRSRRDFVHRRGMAWAPFRCRILRPRKFAPASVLPRRRG